MFLSSSPTISSMSLCSTLSVTGESDLLEPKKKKKKKKSRGMCFYEYIQHICPCDQGHKCSQQYRGMADAQHPDGRIIIGHRMEFYTPAPGRPCALQRHRQGGVRAGPDPACPNRDYAACVVVDTKLHDGLCNECEGGWTGRGCEGVK